MLCLLPKFIAFASMVEIIFAQVMTTGPNSSAGSNNIFQDTYDFVIVGGGTSGCALANRLSENFRVLVLEEGGLPPEDFDIPAKVVGLYATSPAVKHYHTIPQQNVGYGSGKNGHVEFMSGKTLGGSSQINGMVFNRGSPHDYDNWAKLTGDPSWKYENLMKYFKRIEDYHGNFPENGDQHGNGGPITISESKYAPGLEALMEAGDFYGYPSRKDPNGPQIPSFTPLEFSKKGGRRVSSFKGYIKPILQTRPQLTIVTGAKVHRIIFDSSTKRAIGVTFMPSQQNNGANFSTDSTPPRYVGASKEVIISAGAIDSPAILMRSGIGPHDVLDSSKIPAVKILPVGHNLHDHLLLWIDFLVDRNTPAGVFIQEVDLNPSTWNEYLETGDGPYSSMKGMHAQAFWVSSLRLQEEWPNPEWADVHLLQSQAAVNFHLEDQLVNIYTRPFLTRPKSRGRVILNSSDVDAMPLFDFQYLSDPEGHDMQVFLEAVKLTVNIYENAPSFQAQGCRLRAQQDENCDGGNFVFGSDEYWICVIRHKAQSGLHAGGSCRMGRGNGEDPEAVVDTRLKVIGVEGLRVVDMSVVPQVTNANTQAAAYVIAEKAADMIKDDWFSECKINGDGTWSGGVGDEMHFCF